MNHLVIYKTPSCSTCGAITRRLDSKGIPYTLVDVTLPENADAAQRLRDGGFMQAPVFGYGGRLVDISGLRDIEESLEQGT